MPTVWPFLTPFLLLSSAVQSSTAQSTIDPAEFQARRGAAMEKVPDGIILLRASSTMKHWDESGFHQDASFYRDR